MKSFLSYLGGKSLLAKEIIPRIPPHKCYCEVFAGAAWILFGKEPSEVEILNDINNDLVTLYRVVKNHPDEFIRCLRLLLTSRDEFERFKKEKPETLTDVYKAVRFYYLLRNGYASRIRTPTFAISTFRRSRFNIFGIEEEISEIYVRLSRVYIENLHFAQAIGRFDRPHTFFYIDPPYWGCEDDYGKGIFERGDFRKLRDLLVGIKGKFILSLNNLDPVRELFAGFKSELVETTYSVSKSGKQRVKELLISNF